MDKVLAKLLVSTGATKVGPVWIISFTLCNDTCGMDEFIVADAAREGHCAIFKNVCSVLLERCRQ